ncbi:Spo0B domain-containing protein [Thermoanaerobacter kivui]|nr:Spo0B domain-containing protein [Thermoanaerobacter kivui]
MASDAEILIEYIKKRRHEILNDLQVVLGYAQLGKYDKVIEHLRITIENLNKDREIFNFDNVEDIVKNIKG